MKKFRGYPDNGLFENFPKISEWKYLELDEKILIISIILIMTIGMNYLMEHLNQ